MEQPRKRSYFLNLALVSARRVISVFGSIEHRRDRGASKLVANRKWSEKWLRLQKEGKPCKKKKSYVPSTTKSNQALSMSVTVSTAPAMMVLNLFTNLKGVHLCIVLKLTWLCWHQKSRRITIDAIRLVSLVCSSLFLTHSARYISKWYLHRLLLSRFFTTHSSSKLSISSNVRSFKKVASNVRKLVNSICDPTLHGSL